MRCASVADRPWRGGRGDARGPRGDVWDGKDAGLLEEALEHPGGAQAEGEDFQWMGGCGRDSETGDWRRAGGRRDAGSGRLVVVLAWHVRMGA